MPESDELLQTRQVIARFTDMELDRISGLSRLEEDLGFDSLDVIEVMIDVGERLGREPALEILSEHPTVAELANLFQLPIVGVAD